jgi:uncharacterized membrane protein YfcA
VEDLFQVSFLPSMDPMVIVSILGIFLVSGIVKGFLGIGLPAAAMAFLTLVMEPTEAIALLTLPIICTNMYQFGSSRNRLATARRYQFFALAIIVSIFITSWNITAFPTEFLTVAIGFAMVVFATNLLFGFALSIGPGIGWQVGIGIVSGILGGLSSIWSPTVAMYLMARNISKDEFIAATGFLFLAGCFPLALGLYLSGVLTTAMIGKSLLGLSVVLIGFRIGEVLRGRVSQDLFRKVVLIGFLVMGTRLMVIGLI